MGNAFAQLPKCAGSPVENAFAWTWCLAYRGIAWMGAAQTGCLNPVLPRVSPARHPNSTRLPRSQPCRCAILWSSVAHGRVERALLHRVRCRYTSSRRRVCLCLDDVWRVCWLVCKRRLVARSAPRQIECRGCHAAMTVGPSVLDTVAAELPSCSATRCRTKAHASALAGSQRPACWVSTRWAEQQLRAR